MIRKQVNRNGSAARTVSAAIIFLACCPCAFALNPNLDVSQYAHTAWSIRDGFFKGTINSIAQTLDGYLWLGTEFGLLRFDGVRTVSWTPPGGELLQSTLVIRLLAAKDGTLWIGTKAGLVSWNGSKLIRYRELDKQAVLALAEGRDGTVWVGSLGVPTGHLCAIRSAAIKCYGDDGAFGLGIMSLFEGGAGDLWVGAATGLWRWKPTPRQLYLLPLTPEIRSMEGTEDGHLLLATMNGMKQFVDNSVTSYSVPGIPRISNPETLLRDRDGGLWIGGLTSGIDHLHQGRTDVFSRLDGLSGDSISALFEDREANIWVATNGGLDRFREFAIPSITVKQGLSTNEVWSLLAAVDGSVWLGTRAGLNKWNHGQITSAAEVGAPPGAPPQTLFQDDHGRLLMFSNRGLAIFEDGRFTPLSGVPAGQVKSIAEDRAGNLWLAHDQGLFHLRERRVVEQIPWRDLGHHSALSLLADGERGLWIGFGFGDGGVAHFESGHIQKSYSVADGLGAGMVSGLQLDDEGTLWAATEGGLSVIKKGRVTTLAGRNGLCDSVHWMIEDDDHAVWLYTPCGLTRITKPDLDTLAAHPDQTIQPAVFDPSDGVRLTGMPFTSYTPAVAKSRDGRLWFVTGEGVSVIDPRHLPVNKLPPPVHIEQIIADRKVVSKRNLAALTRDLEIDYTALSLVAPEKNRFKYKLEGYDSGWQNAGGRRQAFYTNLSPRNYRFRVIASNNSGVWNDVGDSLEFSVDPAYYQTVWFRGLVMLAAAELIWLLYRLRLRQVTSKVSLLYTERLAERTRIARELHDTLLQNFQGSLLVMQAARNLLSRRAEEAATTLDDAIQLAQGAITEGRIAIQDIRGQGAVQNDLPQLLTATGLDLGRASEVDGNPVIFRVAVEGDRKDLDPIIQDESYGIARELLRNAFQHAQAHQIEAEIRYENRLLRVRVRDDGRGIEPEIVKAGGRAGHWGLLGIRERAKRIGARLDFWSEVGAGTEVELSIPSSIAYKAASNGRRFPFHLRRKPNR